MGSIQESDPQYSKLEHLDGFPYLDTSSERDAFMRDFLLPKMNEFRARFGEGDDPFDCHTCDADDGSGAYDRYQLAVEDEGTGDSYAFEVARVEPLVIVAGSERWRQFVREVNDYEYEGDVPPLRLDPSKNPGAYTPELYMASQYSFHAGRPVSKTMEYGYKVGEHWLQMHYANGEYTHSEYDMPPQTVEDAMAKVEHDMTHRLSVLDMRLVLATLAAFNLHELNYDNQENIIVPDFSQKTRYTG